MNFVGTSRTTENDSVITITRKTEDKADDRRFIYECVCSKCSLDKELYPTPFRVKKNDFLKSIPCGCSKSPRYSREQYKILLTRKLKEHGYTLMRIEGDTINNKSKAFYTCDKGHNTSNTISMILAGRKCSVCSRKSVGLSNSKTHRKSTESVMGVLKEQVPNSKFVSFEGLEYINGSTTINLVCLVSGKSWSNQYRSIKNGTGCPCCSTSGFRKSSPASIYIVEWSLGSHKFIKFGITNRKVEERINQQKTRTLYHPRVVLSHTFEDGTDAKELEDLIKNTIHASPEADRGLFPDGFTETLPMSCIDDVLEIIKGR